jgi:hypothetical protein
LIMKTTKKGSKAAENAPSTSEAKKDILELPVPAKQELVGAKPRTKAAAIPKKRSISKAPAKTANSLSRGEKETPVKKRRSSTATSPVKKMKALQTVAAVEPITPSASAVAAGNTAAVNHLAALSPVDRLLALPTLPVLERENRARLQMQSPTKLHFYWSVRENPWAILRKAFGDDIGSYTLVLKLVEMRSGSEQIHNVDPDGTWWFDVRPDGEYRAEIGFYAPNRPYIRIVYSNVVETPRLKPSPRIAAESDWTVSSQRFAKVLDVAGFARDAFDVALAGDEPVRSATAAREALQQFTNNRRDDQLAVIDDEDIRFALLAFAEGKKLDELRWKISSELFDYLQTSETALEVEGARASLREHFELDDLEFEAEEAGSAVFGASLVNFPRRAKRPRLGSKYSPESSHSLGTSSRH